MKYRKLPGIDFDLSVVGFGCWATGGKWWGDDVTDDASVDAIRRAVELGVNWFDTAPLYGYGHADDILVKALGSRIRDVFIATKVGVRWDNEDVHATSDLTPEHIIQDCESSLRRLEVDRIDLLQVHWPCEGHTPLDETLGALQSLQAQGKIRAFGLCNYGAPALESALKLAPVATLQTPYSMIRREFEHGLKQVVFREEKQRLGVIAYEPLARGLLSGKFLTQPSFPDSDLRSRDDRFRGRAFFELANFARTVTAAAKKVNLPPAALAIGWVAARSGVSVVVAGAKTRQQVEENVKAALVADRADFWQVMDPIVNAFRAGGR